MYDYTFPTINRADQLEDSYMEILQQDNLSKNESLKVDYKTFLIPTTAAPSKVLSLELNLNVPKF